MFLGSVHSKQQDFSYLQLGWPFCSVEQNHLCNFGRGHYEEHSCKLFKIWTTGSGDVVSRKSLWAEDGQKTTHDGRRLTTIDHLESLAQVS